jgi:signal transduction histidine kinase
MVRTDRRALSQIVLNLANNAIKFTDAGAVRIEIAAPGASDQGVEIRIVDTGPGIRPDDQKDLFKAFTKLSTPTGRHEGTGLGLHLSQKLAELLGGSIRVTSEIGNGSVFILSLPAA